MLQAGGKLAIGAEKPFKRFDAVDGSRQINHADGSHFALQYREQPKKPIRTRRSQGFNVECAKDRESQGVLRKDLENRTPPSLRDWTGLLDVVPNLERLGYSQPSLRMHQILHWARCRRFLGHSQASRRRVANQRPAPVNNRAAAVGSGTAVILRPQLARVPSPPEETSATKSVQVPLGSAPLKPLRKRVRAALSKTLPEESGSMARPSTCQVPVSWPLT